MMICQNCKKNEANMHMKRIINGRAEEFHICSDCARSLGYSGSFSDFGFGFGDLLGGIFGLGDGNASSERCPLCGKTFAEIAEDGKVGCAECYNTFYEKLLPSLKRIHGNINHKGKSPLKTADAQKTEYLEALLAEAVASQNFEDAVKIRDEINRLRGEL